MKKIIICFLSLCLLWTTPLNVFADSTYDYDESTKITVSVPEKHKIEIETNIQEGVVLYVDGEAVNSTTEVDRLSEHTFTMDRFGEDGREIKQVFLNGEDITDEIFGEGFTVSSVYEDLEFSIVYADEDAPSTTETTTTTTSTTETTSTTTTTIAETSTNTTHSELQTTAKFTSATTANQNNDDNPKTGDSTLFEISIFLVISALCVYLFRKKE